ncbi:MAG TPA: PEP-CTERM sorting domain-containing protein, partial [Lacipirellulaceae bacterium]|nr:PEP-CTERM sorting domain-containing protein [Lacipirellulaceae bacterium]
ALLIVNSDAGEIVAFGGGAPFFSFGSNGGGNGYTPGSTILLGFTERGGGDGVGGTANTIEYFIDRDPFNPGGESSSGPLAWSNLELGPLTYNVGAYLQGGAANGAADSMHAVFSNVTYTAIPEPATIGLGLLGIVGLFGLGRRRG